MINFVELDRIAALETLRLVRGAAAAAAEEGKGTWGRPTPCAGWTLLDLLGHMAAQNHGFAAAARGEGGLPAHWRVPDIAADPAGAYAESVAVLIVPFAEAGGTEKEFVLPELGRSLPGRVAVSFHFLDLAVHAWDLARTLALEVQLPDTLWESALHVARRVPVGEETRGPDAFFAPVRPVSGRVTPLAETLALLGRSAHWSPEPPGSH
ncbi:MULTISPECIES: TIGR03086 family metal-binding protein [unclassified Streptomyces]|uniref:TIGR03086 family metal-binding protein n=1 Tax=unclassified Streptomyces TaxID=2593676 RepID=UPI000CDA1177|nr:TIGR03086 family metal-binding protein [Streptomyces sp. SM10]